MKNLFSPGGYFNKVSRGVAMSKSAFVHSLQNLYHNNLDL